MSTSESILHSYVKMLHRRWAAGLITASAVLAVLTPVAIGLPNLYRSSASLIVDQVPDPLGQPNAQMIEMSGRLQTIRQEALSRQRVLDLANELDLYPEARKAGLLDAVVAMMQRDVRIVPTIAPRSDGRTSTISFSVSYSGGDPQKVATVANRLAQFYIERNGAMREQHASRQTEALRTQLNDVRQQLESQENRVTDFMRRNAGSLPAQLSSNASKYNQLTQQYQQNTQEITRLSERRENAQNEIARLSTPTGGADLTDPAVRLPQAQRELAALEARFFPNSPQIRNKKAEITGLQAQLAARTGNSNTPRPESSVLSTLREQIDGWDKRLAELREANASIQQQLTKLDAIMQQAPVSDAEFERISRDARQTRQLYESLHTRYQSALVGERQQGQAGTEFQLLDAAVAAELPSAPDRRLLVAVSVMAALGLGIGVILLLDRLDHSFRSVDELRAFTHVPVLATIPKISPRTEKVRRVLLMSAAGLGVCSILVAVSLGVFHFAQRAELITRMFLPR